MHVDCAEKIPIVSESTGSRVMVLKNYGLEAF